MFDFYAWLFMGAIISAVIAYNFIGELGDWGEKLTTWIFTKIVKF